MITSIFGDSNVPQLYHLIQKDPAFPIEYSKRIIGLRNQIIHAYDSISDENIRAILTRHIPVLKEEVLRFIKKSE